MSASRVGTIWSVVGVPDSAVVILAGPFSTPRGRSEHLVAPLYTGGEPGFAWTSEDVRLEERETGLEAPRFAAIWNARPMLEADLGLQLGGLSQDATTAVLDVYWASLNDRPLGRNPRLGKPIRKAADPTARFQAAELERWEPLSGRVFEQPLEVFGSVVVPWATYATFGVDLATAIEDSESFVGPISIAGKGPTMVWLTGRWPIGVPGVASARLPDLFVSEMVTSTPYIEQGVALSVPADADANAPSSAANSELALAA